MVKKVLGLVRKFIVAVLLIYAYNKIAIPSNLFIPMNMLTILLVTFCGIPALIMLVLFSMFII